jgi:hypothetical protein
MNVLEKLINQKVIATVETDEKNCEIEGTVSGIDIDDYHFQNKGEHINITVSVKPKGKIPKGIEEEDLYNIPLENIRKG